MLEEQRTLPHARQTLHYTPSSLALPCCACVYVCVCVCVCVSFSAAVAHLLGPCREGKWTYDAEAGLRTCMYTLPTFLPTYCSLALPAE